MKRLSDPIEPADRPNLFPTLDNLVDRWCERRALLPLRVLLPVYPLGNALTDGLADLHEALREVENLREELNPAEQELVTYARRITQTILDER